MLQVSPIRSIIFFNFIVFPHKALLRIVEKTKLYGFKNIFIDVAQVELD